MKTNINKSWNKILEKELKKDYFISLLKTTQNNYNNNVCFPEKRNIFSAFKHCSIEKLKVINELFSCGSTIFSSYYQKIDAAVNLKL